MEDQQAQKYGATCEAVILLHGLASNPFVMWPIQRHLERFGFETVNWSYPSMRHSIKWHACRLREQIQNFSEDSRFSRVHLVAHSMGGIVVRAALATGPLQQLGRIVTLASPHHGSHAATKLSQFLGFCKPLCEMCDFQDSYVRQVPGFERHEVGGIAATHDRVVRLASTYLDGMSDFVKVDAGHTSLLFRKEVATMVRNFLRTGRFRNDRGSVIAEKNNEGREHQTVGDFCPSSLGRLF